MAFRKFKPHLPLLKPSNKCKRYLGRPYLPQLCRRRPSHVLLHPCANLVLRP
jgi:hypothetical protein